LDEQLKQRLVGAAVIVSLIVIFVPMLLDEPDDSEPFEMDTRIPAKPPVLRQPLPARESLPKPVSAVPMTSVAESEQEPAGESAPAEAQPPAGESDPPLAQESLSQAPVDGGEAASGRSTPTAWLIQVASFTHRDNATRLVERLRQADIPAQLNEAVVDGKRHYRVQILPQLARKDAEKLTDRIKKEFKLKATLRRYSD
jgi:DedD protein